MKNNKQKTRMTKIEKRRLTFEKRNVKKEQNFARYGAEGGSALVVAKTAGFNRRFIAAFLALVFAISCLVIGVNFAGRADDSETTGIVDGYAMHTKAENGLALSKGLKSHGDGTYDIRLEAYSIGTTKQYMEQIPTDYVLIADQSGSMSENDVPTGYDNGTTKNWKVSDGSSAYYYKETDADGVDHYYRVYRKYGDMYEYHAPDTVYTGDCIGNLSWFQREQVQDLGAASEYYYNPALDTSNMKTGVSTDNRMYPVLVSSQGATLSYWIRFRFTDINGTTYALKYPDTPYYKSPTGGLFGPGDWWGPVPYTSRLLPPLIGANDACKALSGNNDERYTYGEFLGITTGMYVRQVLFSRHNNYSQLAYRDDNGVEHMLIDADYCNSNGTPVGGACDENGKPSDNHLSTEEAYWHGTLYTASGTTTRLNALKAAMTEFINTVSSQENDDGSKPNHRVAIVGFAGENSSNTELLTGINLNTSASNKTGYRYFRNETTTQRYKEALLDVTDNAQLTKLNNAVQALDASGGTEGQYGFYMAKNILDNRDLTKFETKGGKEVDRLTIVVYFTDGTPGNYENDNQYAYGNEVVDAAYQLKIDTKVPNVEIYSIGTFGFADSEPLVYEKYTGNSNEYKYDPDYVKTLTGTWNSGYMYRIWLRNTQGYGDVATDTVYDYMRTITTEFKGATKFVDASWYGTGTKSDNGVYTDMVSRVRGASNGLRRYFLCTDLSALSRVFTTIGSEQSGASTTVDLNDGYLYDELSTYFSRDELAQDDLLVETFKPNYGANDEIQSWTQTDSSGIEARWNDDNTGVTVTGFNYSDHYVSKTAPNPEKVRLTIRGVKTITTGTKFPSNKNNSGIYAKDEPVAVAAFPIPETSRYKYTLQTTGANTTPDVTVKFKLTNGNTYVNDETYGDLTFIDGYATWTGATNGSTIIFEDVPDNYKLEAVVENGDTSGAYTYTLKVNDESKEFSTQDSEKPIYVTHVDSIIKVDSVANSRTVTITETVDDSAYANESDKFTPTVYLVPTGDVSVLNDTQRYGTWTLVEGTTDRYTTDAIHVIQANGEDKIELTIPAGWKLIVDQEGQNNYTVEQKTYTPENGNATQFSNGEEITINDNTAFVITNTRPSIPVEGLSDSSNHNWIIYILVGMAAIAVIAGGIFLWKKKDEFVEQ